MQFDLVIPGRPIPKGRPRFTRTGHTYTPREVVAAEQDIALAYIAQAGPEFHGPVGLSLDFTSTDTFVSIWEEEWTSPLRGDLDNYVKLVSDGLQKVAYQNDKAIVVVHARKL